MTDAEIKDFCARWGLSHFGVFGSILRDTWRPDSDIDIVVEFAAGIHWPWGGFVGMREELEQHLGREVDLVELTSVRESRVLSARDEVLGSMQLLYAA